MALRRQILGSPETFADLAWAAEERFREAEALLLHARFAGAIYLLGLASEMWLKLAAFRLIGAAPGAPIGGLLPVIRTWMAARLPSVTPEGYHSLRFWAEFLALRRQHAGRPLPAEVAGALRHHVVGRLYEDWKIDLRYRKVIPDERQAWRVYNDACWLRATQESFWR
jgi:hypothetical protein